MANSLKLYVDTQNKKLVQSDTDASDFTLPTFFRAMFSRRQRTHQWLAVVHGHFWP